MAAYTSMTEVTPTIPAVSGTSSPLTDYPVPIIIYNGAGRGQRDLSPVLAQGYARRKQIMVTAVNGSSETECPVEIVEWASDNSLAILLAKTPSFNASTKIRLYFGGSVDNPNVGDKGSAIAKTVWSNGYEAVWHWNDTGAVLIDSTGKHNGTIYGSPTIGHMAKKWPVMRLNNSSTGSQWASIQALVGSLLSLKNAHNMTVQTWVAPASRDMLTGASDGQTRWLHKGGEWQFNYYNYDAPNAGRPAALADYVFVASNPNTQETRGSGAPLLPYGVGGPNCVPANEFRHMTVRYDVAQALVDLIDSSPANKSRWVSLYHNGYFPNSDGCSHSMDSGYSFSDGTGPSQYPIVISDTGSPLEIGHSALYNTWWNGWIGEMRIQTVRMANWIAADVEGQKDNLLTYGPIQNITPPATGILVVTCNVPGATILVDGLSTSPGSYPEFPKSYSWSAAAPGYGAQNGSVTVIAGQTATLAINLVAAPGESILAAFETGASGHSVWGPYLVSQSFPLPAAKVTAVSFQLYNLNCPAGNFEGYLYVADAKGKPTGNALGHGSILTSAISKSAYTWPVIRLDTPVSVAAGQYVVVMKSASGTSTGACIYYHGDPGLSYIRGISYTGSGTTWNTTANAWDVKFRIYGYPAVGGNVEILSGEVTLLDVAMPPV